MRAARSVFLLAAVLVVLPAHAMAQAARQEVAAGARIAKEHCAACHAVGRTGTSKRKGAPPFRILHARYNVENLQEAFVEGVAVGHRGSDMPEFEFTPERTDALIAYLKSLKR